MNPWIQHVREFANKNNMSYSKAIKDPDCSKSYKTKVGSGPSQSRIQPSNNERVQPIQPSNNRRVQPIENNDDDLNDEEFSNMLAQTIQTIQNDETFNDISTEQRIQNEMDRFLNLSLEEQLRELQTDLSRYTNQYLNTIEDIIELRNINGPENEIRNLIDYKKQIHNIINSMRYRINDLKRELGYDENDIMTNLNSLRSNISDESDGTIDLYKSEYREPEYTGLGIGKKVKYFRIKGRKYK